MGLEALFVVADGPGGVDGVGNVLQAEGKFGGAKIGVEDGDLFVDLGFLLCLYLLADESGVSDV